MGSDFEPDDFNRFMIKKIKFHTVLQRNLKVDKNGHGYLKSAQMTKGLAASFKKSASLPH